MPRTTITKGMKTLKLMCPFCKSYYTTPENNPHKTCGAEECVNEAKSEGSKKANFGRSSKFNPYLKNKKEKVVENLILTKKEVFDKEKEADEIRIKYYKMMGRM